MNRCSYQCEVAHELRPTRSRAPAAADRRRTQRARIENLLGARANELRGPGYVIGPFRVGETAALRVSTRPSAGVSWRDDRRPREVRARAVPAARVARGSPD